VKVMPIDYKRVVEKKRLEVIREDREGVDYG
jgi:hypothetical protein